MAQVGFYTFGIFHDFTPDDPRRREFFERLTVAFALAAHSPGFVARQEARRNGVCAPFIPVALRNRALATLTVWESLETVFAYAYRGYHLDNLRRRAEWFERGHPTYVAWWMADGHLPDWYEAAERFDHFHTHGPTPTAFDFRTPFDADGQPTKIGAAARRISSPGAHVLADETEV